MKFKASLIAVITVITVISCENKAKETKEEPPAEMTQAEMAERGKYLVTILDCNVCHTPKIFTPTGPVFDTTRILSGHPADYVEAPYDATMIGAWTITNGHFTNWIGAFGKTYAANLTPHETGLGKWKEENFIQALKTGKHMGMPEQRPIMPPMPWEAYGHMPDEDLKAIWAYLQTIPPIDNAVPVYMPPGPPANM